MSNISEQNKKLTSEKLKILQYLNCALSTDEDEHLCEDPVTLSCNHFICKKCLKPEFSNIPIKCNICNETNTRDLNELKESNSFLSNLETNLNQLFNEIHKKLEKSYKTCKELIYGSDERIDVNVQFLRDEIQIKIESIKMELDSFYDSFSKELDVIKDKWKGDTKIKELKIKFDQNDFEGQLKSLENNINKQEKITKENLYYFQNQVKQIREIVKEYNENTPKLQFQQSKLKVDKDVIGELIFETAFDLDKNILSSLKKNVYERHEIGFDAWEICELPNGNVLVSDYYNRHLVLYTSDMQYIRTVKNIDRISFVIFGITTNGNDAIFMCDWNVCLVVKTDLELNKLRVFGGGCGPSYDQVNCPSGICYYNKHVYVCDFYNKCIKKLNEELEIQNCLRLTFSPQYIRNINNVAIVKLRKEKVIYFYDLDSFELLKKYEGHNGIVGESKTHFYEYFVTTKTLYYYNKNGDLVDQVQTNGFGFNDTNDWGSICKIKSKLYITSCGNNYFISIP